MYSFPVLKHGEILQCLHELEIQIDEEQLVECERHRDTIRAATERLAELCLGSTRDEISRFSACSDYPELHEDAVLEVGLFRRSVELMRVCGVGDYGLRDWFWPSSRRVRRQMSAVINFAKFREEQLAEYRVLCEGRDASLEELLEAKMLADESAQEVHLVEAQTASERLEAAAALADCEQLQGEIANLQSDLARLEASGWAVRAEEAEARAAEASEELAKAEGVKNSVTPPLIELPGWKLLMNDDACRAELRATARRANELSAAIETITETLSDWPAVADITSAAKSVEDIEKQLAAHKATLAELRTASAAAAELDLEIEELGADTDAVNAKTKAIENRLALVKADSKTRHDADLEIVAVLREDLALLRGDLEALDAAEDDLDARRAAATAQFSTTQDLHQAELSSLTAAAKDLIQLVHDHDASLAYPPKLPVFFEAPVAPPVRHSAPPALLVTAHNVIDEPSSPPSPRQLHHSMPQRRRLSFNHSP